MMRLDLAYKNRANFLELIASFPKARVFYSERIDPEFDKKLGVGANTVRAFRGIKKPSEVYRRWARATIKSIKFKNKLLAVTSIAQFEVLHKSLCRSIRKHWTKETGQVPIDSSVFTALDCLFSHIFVSDGRAMGHIKTEQAYRFYQELIRRMMREMKAPPLFFDFYAWNIRLRNE